jgi:hypothetical protein
MTCGPLGQDPTCQRPNERILPSSWLLHGMAGGWRQTQPKRSRSKRTGRSPPTPALPYRIRAFRATSRSLDRPIAGRHASHGVRTRRLGRGRGRFRFRATPLLPRSPLRQKAGRVQAAGWPERGRERDRRETEKSERRTQDLLLLLQSSVFASPCRAWWLMQRQRKEQCCIYLASPSVVGSHRSSSIQG